MKINCYNPYTYEEFLKHFEEETITLDTDYLDDDVNMAEEKYREKEYRRYINIFNTYGYI